MIAGHNVCGLVGQRLITKVGRTLVHNVSWKGNFHFCMCDSNVGLFVPGAATNAIVKLMDTNW